MTKIILSVNAGSSSVKISVYTAEQGQSPKQLAETQVDGLTAPPPQLKYTRGSKIICKDQKVDKKISSQRDAFTFLLDELVNDKELTEINKKEDIAIICHRVVHGGDYDRPQLINKNTYHHLEKLTDLAPLHNASALEIVKSCIKNLPNTKNVAVFDSQFHQTIPEHIRTYPIQTEIAKKNKLRKYGFHGISYSFITRQVADFLEKPQSETNLIVLHLGSGASACAIKSGTSWDTSMGLTPLAGLPGATRSGSVDPSLVFHYATNVGKLSPSSTHSLHISRAEEILNKESGWKSLTGTTNFGAIASSDDPKMKLAFDIFVDRICSYVGSYYVTLNGKVDALVFAGGIGEKSDRLRKRVVGEASCLGFEVDDELNGKTIKDVVQDNTALPASDFAVRSFKRKAARTPTELPITHVPCSRMEAESALHQQLPTAYRALQPQAPQAIHGQPHLGHHTLPSQPSLDLGLDDNDPVFHQDLRLQDPNGHAFQSPNPFDRNNGHRSMHVQTTESPHTPQQHNGGGQFGILTTGPIQHNSIGRLHQEEDLFGTPEGSDQKSNGHLSTKIVVDPPNLAEWRQKLFNVDEMITLSAEEFETYFPHVDNVYSHRSTQRYKRKPFVSHYWDCRLKGRPPGTPKSDDPNKKKRKRTARQRDLCDVKIKITEYFPGAMLRADFTPDGGQPQDPGQNNNYFAPGQPGGQPIHHQQQFGMPMVNSGIPPGHPGATGQRYYTIQRVNGNGGNGKGDGVAGPHKHLLSESDRVKKNSVQRFMMKKDKEDKKTQKTYHKKASGNALATVRRHSKDHDLKLFGSCFCPFVQRVWIALEAKGLSYQYIEIDPYRKPQALLEINPRGLIPAIRHGDWGCGESTVLLEYLEDLGVGTRFLPQDSRLKATCRLWADHINRHIVPAFYQLLQAQEFSKQLEYTKKLHDQIAKLVEARDSRGPFFLGPNLSYVDIQIAPWMLRFSRVLKQYRGFPDPPPGSRLEQWMQAIEDNEHIKNTTSLDELYTDSYERYAQNRPNTSELADAINGGYGLP
ncbi:hypothetical protein B7494_g3753 [Chlorociboria aeruginascens]|nr:hypothetical protein B7494_g3753 [Chlorociboria aeruginascens]